MAKTVEWVKNNGVGHLAMVSDQIRDAEFMKKVYLRLLELDSPGVNKDGVTFYKIPGPPIG